MAYIVHGVAKSQTQFRFFKKGNIAAASCHCPCLSSLPQPTRTNTPNPALATMQILFTSLNQILMIQQQREKEVGESSKSTTLGVKRTQFKFRCCHFQILNSLMCAVRTEALPCVLIKCGGNRVALICGKCFVSLGFCVYMERCRNGVASNWGVLIGHRLWEEH